MARSLGPAGGQRSPSPEGGTLLVYNPTSRPNLPPDAVARLLQVRLAVCLCGWVVWSTRFATRGLRAASSGWELRIARLPSRLPAAQMEHPSLAEQCFATLLVLPPNVPLCANPIPSTEALPRPHSGARGLGL